MAEEPKSKKPLEEKEVDIGSSKAGSDGKQSKKTASEREPSLSEALSHFFHAVKPKVVRGSKKAYDIVSHAISGVMGSKKKDEGPAGDDQNKAKSAEKSSDVSKVKSDKATKSEKPSDQNVKSDESKGEDSKDS